MKRNTRIKDAQAIELGLSLNKSKQYKIGEEEYAELKRIRNRGLLDSFSNLEVDKTTVKHLWKKTKNESLFIKNPFYLEGKEKSFKDLKELLINDLKKYAPTYKKFNRELIEDPHLLVIDPADIHIGKLCSSFESGESYDNQIAVKRVLSGVKGILNKAKGFSIDKILFVGGNDILHIDTPKRTTTSGTHQDTDGMWYDNYLTAKKLYIDVLELLLTVADVHFVYNPSNHDYTNGFFLCDVVATHFYKNKNITFDTSISHRKYFKYGFNLIGTTHGDGAKQQDLGSLMSVEAKEHWADSRHRYYYTHHVHHKTSKDYINVTVESLRSPSGTDSWHHINGYQHAPKAVEGFIHHKENGQIARLTHIF